MLHEAAPVLSLAVSPDSELLASGGGDGCLKVWRLRAGGCVRRFHAAHTGAVLCLCFSRDGGQVLSGGGGGGAARLWGLKSGKMLREFRAAGAASDALLCAARFSADNERVITAAADGAVRLFNARTAEQVAAFCLPRADAAAPPTALLSCHLMPVAAGDIALLVCSAEGDAHVLCGRSGAVLRSFVASEFGGEQRSASNLIAAVPSRRGAFVYALTAGGALLCFCAQSGRLERRLSAHDVGLTKGGSCGGVVAHPHRNVAVSYGSDGTVRLWRA